MATLAIMPIASTIAVLICEMFQNWFDRRIPDDFPLAAGAWLERAIRRLGYDSWLKVIVSERSACWYAPEDRVIHLDADTYYKRDPLYWATAAHELGHGRFAFRHPVAHGLIQATRVMRIMLVALGAGLACGNVLVAVPLVTDIAFACLVVGLVLHIAPVIGEVYASSFAVVALRHSGVGPNRMRAVAAYLVLACGTYMTEIAAGVAMLMRWHLVERAIGSGWTPSGGVTALGYLVAAIATIWFTRATYWRTRGIPKLEIEKLVANIAIVWLMWDCGHPWLAALAVVPMGHLVYRLMMVPGILVASVIPRLTRGMTGADVTPELVEARSRGRDTLAAGKRAYESILKTPSDRIPLRQRIVELLDLVVFPLIIVFWLS